MIIKRRVTRGFVQIANEVVRDRRLQLDEHGLLHYLLSLPDDWEVNLRQIETYWKIGRDRRRRLFRALAKTGWARLERIESDDGAFLGRRWIIGDEPGPEITDEALDGADEDPEDADNGPPTNTTAAPESQAPDALVSPRRETPFQAVGSADGRVTRPPENPAVLRRKTPDEERDSKNTIAGVASNEVDDEDGSPPPKFGELLRHWPNDNVVSEYACEKSFARLSDAQKRQARDTIRTYLDDCRSKGQTRICDLRTYLDERRWERFGKRPAGRTLFVVQKGTPEAERWREHLRKTAPHRLELFEASLRNAGYTTPSQWPPPIDPDAKPMNASEGTRC